MLQLQEAGAEPWHLQGTAGMRGHGEGCGSSRPGGGGGTFGEHLGRDSGSWSLAAGEGQVPGVPLSPSQAGGLQQSPAGMAVPCFPPHARGGTEGELCAGGIDAIFSS